MLPSSFVDKIRLHWTQIFTVFSHMDMHRAGKLSRSDFEAMAHRSGLKLTSQEVDLVFRIFDKNGDGRVDFREFASVLGDIIKPPSQPAEGTGLNFGVNSDYRKKEGKRIIRADMQAKDTEGSGKPLIQVYPTERVPDLSCGWLPPWPLTWCPEQTIMEGKFYLERPSPAERGSVDPRRIPGLTFDAHMRQPMSKSLIEGVYYLARIPPSKSFRSIQLPVLCC